MSYPQKSYFSPDKTQKASNIMIKSLLITPSKNQSIHSKNVKSQFKDCFYHNKPIKFLCISQNCQNKYFTLCQHLECKSMHSHPNLKLIQTSKFQQFQFKHLKSINLLKQKINKYEKEVVQTVLHKLTKDFEMIRNALDTFYIHKAAKKISEGKMDELNSKQLNQFIEKSILLEQTFQINNELNNNNNKSSSITNSINKNSPQKISKYSFLQNTFIQQKTLIVTALQKLEQSISKLIQTTQYRQLTLQQLILEPILKNGHSPGKSLIKKQTFTSKIIQFQEEYQTIIKMLRQNRVSNFQQFKLVYRASENQFSSKKYHQAVDSKVPVLLLIQADTGKKFGAFINCKTTQSNDWISDPTGISFIYSLDHNQTYRLKSGADYRTKAIFGGKKGPQIGLGCDIYISDKCHENSESGSNFGGSYQLPFGLQFGTKKARSYLAGKQNFAINQYEAYLLQ